jgi:pyrimidine-nucleoside phosphorylase
MFINEIILKKKNKLELTKEEINFVIEGYTKGSIPDYQVSSLLMAIVLNGLNDDETTALTMAMMNSGQVIDLKAIKGIKSDKHSTGGVGDKTSLVLGPMVASCGVKVAKMSGRGLGHTGGTLDKLEAIPGFKIERSKKDFIAQVNKIGFSIIGQSGDLVPADKKLYALRDVTGTVQSIPLIASSIMSKKLATGADTILLDVKYGSGAFYTDPKDAIKLAKTMVAIGTKMKRDTKAIITSMDQPLGQAIGNSLEIIETINTLSGKGPKDLVELCLKAGVIILKQAKIATTDQEARKMLIKNIENGSALNVFKQMVKAQEGDDSYISNPKKFGIAKHVVAIKLKKGGYIESIDTLKLGLAAMHLGAGRAKKEDKIDPSAGIMIYKKVGDLIKPNDVVLYIHTNLTNYDVIIADLISAFKVSAKPVNPQPLIYSIID